MPARPDRSRRAARDIRQAPRAVEPQANRRDWPTSPCAALPRARGGPRRGFDDMSLSGQRIQPCRRAARASRSPMSEKKSAKSRFLLNIWGLEMSMYVTEGRRFPVAGPSVTRPVGLADGAILPGVSGPLAMGHCPTKRPTSGVHIKPGLKNG